MSLIKCPECNGKVSDTAKTCPHCGFDLIKEKENDSTNLSTDPIKIEKPSPKQYWEFYLFSFFIPLLGFIIGGVLLSKNSPTEKQAGENCIGFAVSSFIICSLIFGVRYALYVLK